MIVPRFTIDMSECMYCNLCVYPCPEECIYMVGGPNESKHEIDYEFSQHKRDGMIFEFSNVTKEDIVNIGGESYLEQKKMKQEKVIEGERLLGIKEKAPLKKVIINPVSVVPTTATAVQQVSNFSPKSLSEIEDPVIRGTAKKIFMASKKAGDDDNTKIDKIIEGIKELDGFTAELEQKLLSLKMTAAPEVVAAVPTLDSAIIEENETAPISKPILELFSIKKINDIEDPIVRGTLKKVYMAGKKEKLLNQEMVDKMKNELESKKLLDQTLIKFLEMLGK